MPSIRQNIEQITRQIEQASKKSLKNSTKTKLLAVSKKQEISKILEAISAGQFEFGENYVQEGVEKIIHIKPHHPNTQWHFIGPIQSNKTALLAQHFDWVHSVDRLKIAERLSQQRPTTSPPLQVLIQINSSGEATKSGIAFDEVSALAHAIASLPNLELRGLMCIPKAETDPEKQAAAFAPMSALFEKLKQDFPSVDTLSMGMSGDMETAIGAGSTMVRIGTAIFGERK